MIDRFDGRALLDFYRDPPPGSAARRSHQEERLQEVRTSPASKTGSALSAARKQLCNLPNHTSTPSPHHHTPRAPPKTKGPGL
jgi:hypothetical protein